MADENAEPGFDVEPIGPAALAAEGKAQRAKALEERAPKVGSFVNEAFDLMHARAEGRAKPITTPWLGVNEALGGGLWPGLHMLIGATGDGKSQWALQVALNAAKAGVPVLYVGLELGRVDLVARLLSLMMADDPQRGGHAPKWSELYLGKDEAGLVAAADYAAALTALPFHLEVAPPFGWNSAELMKRAEALRELHLEPKDEPGSRPMLVVLDYLQVITSPPDAREELRERIGKASYAGRAVARDMNAAVLMISSTSRENSKLLWAEKAKTDAAQVAFPWELDARGFVGLGKESGEIEYAADSVLTMIRGERQDRHTEMHLAVAKVRAGVTGWRDLNFNGGWFWEPKESNFGPKREPQPKPPRGKGAKKSAEDLAEDSKEPPSDLFEEHE